MQRLWEPHPQQKVGAGASDTDIKANVADVAARAKAAARARKAEAALKAPVAGGNTLGANTIMQQTEATNLPLDLDDWELSEGGLRKGSTLSRSKALMDDYPED